MRPFILGAALLFSLSVGDGYADTSGGQWSFSTEVQWRLFPKGLSSLNELRWRVPLYDSEHILLKGGQLQVGAIVPVSPASLHPGGYIELTPISPLAFRVTAQQLRYFGLFGNLSSFESLDVDWSEDNRPGDIPDGRHETGYQLTAEATLQLAFGPVVAVAKGGRAWLGADVEEGRTWYESTSNLLYSKDDHLDYGSAIAGAFVSGDRESDKFLLVTARWEGYRSGDGCATRHLAGSLVVWKPGWMPERKLIIGVIGAVYLDDPYEEGSPYFAGFTRFSWDDLWGSE